MSSLRVLVCVGLVVVMACGGDDDGAPANPGGVPSDYCEQFGPICGGPSAAADCHRECDSEQLVEGEPSDCWEIACGVVSQTCLQGKRGSDTWWACMLEHDVAQACSELEDICLAPCDAPAADQCDSVMTAANESDCADLLVTLVAAGCIGIQ